MPSPVTTYTTAKARAICDRIATGETLRSICRSRGMPTNATVYKWLAQNPEFKTLMDEARKVGYDAIADDALSIADTPMLGEETEIEKEGRKSKTRVKKGDMIAHRKLQVWTRLQLLAKWDPDRYGNTLRSEITGKNGGPVLISDTERAAKVAALVALAQARKDGDGAQPV